MTPSPITEADLHAWVDGHLDAERRAVVDAWLADHPDERRRVDAWRVDAERMRDLLAPVAREPLPLRLAVPTRQRPLPWLAIAASVLIAITSGGIGWFAHGRVHASSIYERSALEQFAHRAAVAHAVYTPEVRRPVEVGADQEQALVTWLSKRIGASIKAPALQSVGYRLVGGRLLPGDVGPVAQFMYEDDRSQRLTLYVSRESHASAVAPTAKADPASFRFVADGDVNVFYWVEGSFGYAISAVADRGRMLDVAEAVYRQLDGLPDPPK
ncbi:anti-sigma factor [soil metagenome]